MSTDKQIPQHVMFNVYQTTEDRYIISRKVFRETITVKGRFSSVDDAFSCVTGGIVGKKDKITIKFDREIENNVYESCIPDIKQSDFINTDRYLSTTHD